MGNVRTDRKRKRPGLRDEDGTSLVELLVGMAVLSIFLGMFTGAVIMLNQATNKAQAITLSSQQLNQAFLNLDKTVRYATAISPPGTGTPSGYWYVELVGTTNTGSALCTQLRLTTAADPTNPQQLQKRSWVPPVPPVSPVFGQFTPVASGIKVNGSTPFLPVMSTTSPYQQLTFSLAGVSGSTSTQNTTSQSAFTFTALNSSSSAPASVVCQGYRP